jgi:hypothetical protein
MSGQEVVFGKRGAPAQRAAPRREKPSPAFLAASEAARAAFLRGDLDSAADVEPAPAAGPARFDEEADMRRFIGANWTGYRELWRKMKDAPDLAPSRSYGAAAFTGLWLLYRKRYALGFLTMALQFGATFNAPEIGALVDLALAFFFGRYGKAIVVRDGLAAIAKLKGECGAADDIDVRIVRAGGTTLVAPIAGALLASWLLIAASGEAAGEGGAILAALLGVKI